MKGDIINIEEHHYRAAKIIIEKILYQINNSGKIYSISVAGESGSGKSETAEALKEVFKKKSVPSMIIQQDDYFLLPPRSNDKKRRKDFSWIGPQEVNLDLMDEHIRQLKTGLKSIRKPLVLFEDDTITEETISTGESKVIIAEGTYTSLLKNIDHKIFILSHRFDTLESRKKRSRAAHELDEFAGEILEKEHKIISGHKSLANTFINNAFEVKFIAC